MSHSALWISARHGKTEVRQNIDVAIARYQRAIRLGGSQGAALRRSAERMLHEANAHSLLLLHEDAARR